MHFLFRGVVHAQHGQARIEQRWVEAAQLGEVEAVSLAALYRPSRNRPITPLWPLSRCAIGSRRFNAVMPATSFSCCLAWKSWINRR
ncbi:hypothetical protein JQS52_27355 [Pseudomonas aeruginosa]|nr:hypothetical protein [Pseudomonas aeruginosa]MBM2556862.1 hypothetical protein [Pseudomonas aeruginosa]